MTSQELQAVGEAYLDSLRDVFTKHTDDFFAGKPPPTEEEAERFRLESFNKVLAEKGYKITIEKLKQ